MNVATQNDYKTTLDHFDIPATILNTRHHYSRADVNCITLAIFFDIASQMQNLSNEYYNIN